MSPIRTREEEDGCVKLSLDELKAFSEYIISVNGIR